MSEITTWTVQRYLWSDKEWATYGTYTSDDSRGEGNAYFSMRVLRNAAIPCRLLTNGVVTITDDPDHFYE